MPKTSHLLVTAATSEPITVQEAMEHCRVTDSAESVYLTGLISVVRSYVEMQTGRALAAETRKLLSDEWAESLDLDRSPAAAVSSIAYWPDGYGAAVTVDSSNYILADGEPSRVIFKSTFSFPALAVRPDALSITYTTAPTTIPLGMKWAMLLMIAHLYDQRAPLNIGNIVNELPFSLSALLASHRIGGWIA